MKQFPYKSTLKRYRILALFFTLLALAIIGKAAYTMFVKRNFWVQVLRYHQLGVIFLALTDSCWPHHFRSIRFLLILS